MIEIRPTTKADCDEFFDNPPPYRIRAHTGLSDGKVVAIGGIGFPPTGSAVAFANLSEFARQYQGGLVLHRFARRIIADAKASGIKRLIANVDDPPTFGNAEPQVAERWLKRLGFEPLTDDKTVWLWRQ